MNPQIAYGEDIMARLNFALADPGDAARLADLVIDALNALAAELSAEVGAAAGDIWEIVVVGNTAMHHLLLGLPVEQLAQAPYLPAVQRSLDVKARDLGLRVAVGSYLHLLPNIAGYVGADHVAMILATRIFETERTVLALDIGTNTEICLAHQGALTCLSCASGPAFEGAHIEHGMRAAPGAIERVRIADGKVAWQTIGDLPPAGICGSGILDAVAGLCLNGIVDANGRMMAHPRVLGSGSRRAFLLVTAAERGNDRPALTVSQRDVCELQLAKAAIRTGIEVLLEGRGIAAAEIDQVIIAGAFGSYIDIASAMTVGLLPHLPIERVRQVGNAAGMGAKLSLKSVAQRGLAQTFAPQIHYIELASHPRFAEHFARSLVFGSAGGSG